MSLYCFICNEIYDWDEEGLSASIPSETMTTDRPICRGCEEILMSIPKKIREKHTWNRLIDCVKLVKLTTKIGVKR